MITATLSHAERCQAFQARFAALAARVAAAEQEAHDLIDGERETLGQAAPRTVALLQRLQALRKVQPATLLVPPKAPPVQATQAQLSLRGVAERVRRSPQEILPLAWSWWDQARRTLRVTQARTTPAAEHELVRQNWQRLRTLLPEALHVPLDMARMHYEHEVLRITYHNDVTFAAQDAVAGIPRAKFFAVEEAGTVFAFDMEELVETISNTFGGVFKNPYPPHALFQHGQVRTILAHPLGKVLRQQQLEQAALRDGVRRETARQLRALGNVLRTDVTNRPEAAVAANAALDAFRLYMLTLPESERQALEKLKISAVDSHTGRTYASTVEDTLGALAGKNGAAICWHKAGDYLAQAAEQLLHHFAPASL